MSYNFKKSINEDVNIDLHKTVTWFMYLVSSNDRPGYNVLYDTEYDKIKSKEYIIISQDRTYYEKKIEKKTIQFGCIPLNTLHILLKSDYSFYEILTKTKDIYYYLPIDIDYEIDTRISLMPHDDMIEIILDFIKKMCNFMNEYLIKDNKKLSYEDVNKYITSACGHKDKFIYKISYHILFPIHLKWEQVKLIYKILAHNIFHEFDLKYGYKFIDKSITKNNQQFRCINQSKLSEPGRINKQFYKTTEMESIDLLVGRYCFEENDDNLFFKDENELNKIIEHIPNELISKIKKENYSIKNKNKKRTIYYQDTKEYKYDLDNFIKDEFKFILNNNYNELDLFSFNIFNIENNLDIFDRKEWCIMGYNIFNYWLSFDNNYKDKLSDKTYNLENYEEYAKTIFLIWTCRGYESKYSSYGSKNMYFTKTISEIKKLGKDHKIKNYSTLNKEEIIELLPTPPKERIKYLSIDEHFEHIEKLFDSCKNNLTCKINYNNNKILLNIINKYSHLNNNNIKKEWDIKHRIIKNSNFENEDFIDILSVPSIEDKNIYKYLFKNKYIGFVLPTGGGKSTRINNIINGIDNYSIKNKLAFSNILVLLPRETLCYSTLETINKVIVNKQFECYKTDGKINKDYFTQDWKKLDRLVLCGESHVRIPYEYYQNNNHKYIIIDEYDTFINSLIGNTMKVKFNERMDKLINYSFKNSENIILADAYLSLPSIEFIKELIQYMDNLKPEIFKNNKITKKLLTFKSDETRFNRHYILKLDIKNLSGFWSRIYFIRDLIYYCNKGYNVNIFVNKKTVLSLIKKVLNKYGIKNIIVDADSKIENKIYYSNNGLELEKQKIQVFGYNSTIGIGCSIENKNYWHKKMVFIETADKQETTITSNIGLQGGERIREITNILENTDNNIDNNNDNNNEFINDNDDNDDEDYHNIEEFIKSNFEKINTLYPFYDTIKYKTSDDCHIYDLYIMSKIYINHRKELDKKTIQNKIFRNNKIDSEEDRYLEKEGYIEPDSDDITNLENARNYENKYNLGRIGRILKKISVNDEIIQRYNYHEIDDETNIYFTIDKNKIDKWYDNNMLLHPDLNKIINNLKVNTEIKNSLNSIYMKECIKNYILKSNNTFNDDNTITSFKKMDKVYYIESKIYEKDKSFYELIFDKIDNNKQLYIWDLINRKQEDGSNLYNDNEKQTIEIIYMLYNYFNLSKYNYSFVYQYILLFTENYNNPYFKPFQYFKNLTSYFSKSCYLSHNEYKFNNQILDFIFNKIIDKTEFIKDFRNVIIKGLDIYKNSSIIDKMFLDLKDKNSLKFRYSNETSTKLSIILENLLGFDIKPFGKRKKTPVINGKRGDIFDYYLTIPALTKKFKISYIFRKEYIDTDNEYVMNFIKDNNCNESEYDINDLICNIYYDDNNHIYKNKEELERYKHVYITKNLLGEDISYREAGIFNMVDDDKEIFDEVLFELVYSSYFKSFIFDYNYLLSKSLDFKYNGYEYIKNINDHIKNNLYVSDNLFNEFKDKFLIILNNNENENQFKIHNDLYQLYFNYLKNKINENVNKKDKKEYLTIYKERLFGSDIFYENHINIFIETKKDKGEYKHVIKEVKTNFLCEHFILHSSDFTLEGCNICKNNHNIYKESFEIYKNKHKKSIKK